MRRELVLLALLICSCGSASPMPSATPPAGIEPEESASPRPTVTPPPSIEAEDYAVYSALIRQNPIGYRLGSFIVIREQTVSDLDSFERTMEHFHVPADLADSYRSRNAASYTLGPNLDVEQDYALMPDEEYKRIFRQIRPGAAMWPDFEARYPGASLLVFFSRVGFNASGDTALADMGYRCDDQCGAGGLFRLVKEDGNWKVQQGLMEWTN